MRTIEDIKKDHTKARINGGGLTEFYPGDYAVSLGWELIDRTIEVFGKKRMSEKKRYELMKELEWADIATEFRKLVKEDEREKGWNEAIELFANEYPEGSPIRQEILKLKK